MVDLQNKLKHTSETKLTEEPQYYLYACLGAATQAEVSTIFRDFHKNDMAAIPVEWTYSCHHHKYISTVKFYMMTCNPDEMDWLLLAMDQCYITGKRISFELAVYGESVIKELFEFHIRERYGKTLSLLKRDGYWEYGYIAEILPAGKEVEELKCVCSY